MPDPSEMTDPLSLEITIEPDTVRRVQAQLAGIRAEIPRVLRLGVNAGVSRIRREIEKAALQVLHIERNILRERIWPNSAKKRFGEDAYGTVRGGKVGWPLTRFPHAKTPRGIAVSLGDRCILYPGSFIANVGGHSGVFQRIGKSRLPIREIKIESVTDVIQELSAAPSIQAAGALAAETKIEKELTGILGYGRGQIEEAA